MRPLSILVISLGLCGSVWAQEGEGEGAPAEEAPAAEAGLETLEQRASYAIGQRVGRDLAESGGDFDMEALFRGLRDAYAGESAMTDAEIERALQELNQMLMEAQEARAEAEAAENLAAGEAFLAENAEREGVVITESGLQYEVLEAGDGAQPTASDRVTVHYRGTLIDGTEFDSSYSRNQPATFPVTGVIQGWIEALQLMKVGAKWKLYIPAELAYGRNPRPGGPIGPNETLVFEVELLSIE